MSNGKPFESIDPPDLWRAPGYTNVTVASGAYKLVFIAGQTALDEKGEIVGIGDPAAQAERTYLNLKRALDAAGGRPEHVIKWNGYLVGDHDWRVILAGPRSRHFGSIRPASTHVRVAALIRPELLIEIEAYAVVPT
ncbi:MAG: RidA family protein [Candidatus Limnocylindria bacterium]